jgi:hypothetical protein
MMVDLESTGINPSVPSKPSLLCLSVSIAGMDKNYGKQTSIANRKTEVNHAC